MAVMGGAKTHYTRGDRPGKFVAAPALPRLTDLVESYRVELPHTEDNVMGLGRTLLALAAAGVVAAPAAAQQLYKYVGPDGTVQYSDRPPPNGQKAEKITRGQVSTISSGAPAAAAAGDAAKSTAPKSTAEREQDFRKRRLEAQEKASKDAKLAEDQRARAEACAASRRQLAGLQSGARVARINEQGERVFLEDDSIQQEIQRLQRDVAETCK
jgi:hypothetical protein